MVAIEQLRRIVIDIAAECKGATHYKINSNEHAVNVAAIGMLVNSLARLHPRWSEEKNTILGWREGYIPTPEELNTNDPLLLMFARSEELLSAWRWMNAGDPTIESLLSGVPAFTKALSALLVDGRLD